MASIAGTSADRSVSVGRVLDRAFGTIRHNPLTTFGLAFLFGMVPTIASTYALQGPASNSDIDLLNFALIMLNWAASIIIGALTQAALTRTTVAHAEGRRASFRETLRAGSELLLQVIVISIIFASAVALGLVLLVIPGIFIYVIWSVATPVLVEERPGIIGSLSRSAELTKGARWPVFGILLLLLAIYWLTSMVVGVVAMFGGGGDIFADGMSAGLLITSGIFGLLMNLLWGVVLASLYVELRNWHDGPDPHGLADVFA